MKRLTNKNHKELGFCAYIGAQNPFKTPMTIGELAGCLNVDYSPRKILEDILGRLAAYEDAMPLERAQELAQAEKAGRMVVLPCKLHESIFYIEDGELFDDVPYEVSLGQKSGEWNESLMFECQYGFCFFEEDVGKTVFLTYKEAKAALKKREADNETVERSKTTPFPHRPTTN